MKRVNYNGKISKKPAVSMKLKKFSMGQPNTQISQVTDVWIIMKKFFTLRVINHCNMLPREIEDVSPQEVL